ncbi:MAG TPA: histidinol-phosphate transaminase [Steroidobacteraceae bacterium]|nr:histidinol-phosphate transaminase [Steroidobacteraceae bacterium]
MSLHAAAHPGALAVPAVRALSPYVPGKPLAELERELGITDSIKLASNENPHGPSPAVLAALRAAIEEVWLYPDGSCHELKGALARHLGVDRACLTIGNGSNDLLVLLAEAFLTPAASAIYSQYGFAIYPLVIRETGARAVEVPALAASAPMPLGHDLAAMAGSIRADTRLVFIANPNNPTGTWLEAGELEAFVRAAPPSTLVVLDEAYGEYARAQGLPDTLSWATRYPNLVQLRTFSKAYGLAGARVGYAISHPEVADVLNRLRPPFNVNSLAQAAALAALGDEAHMQRSVAATVRELPRVAQGIRSLGLRVGPSAANFLLVHIGARAHEVNQGLLERGVIVRPLGSYALPEHLRISIGLPAHNDRLLSALAQLARPSP